MNELMYVHNTVCNSDRWYSEIGCWRQSMC